MAQKPVSGGVGGAPGAVNSAVDFDDQFATGAAEVNDEVGDGVLAPEVMAIELARSG